MSSFIDRTIRSQFSFVRESLGEKGFGGVLLLTSDSRQSRVFKAKSLKALEANFEGNSFVLQWGKSYFSQENAEGGIPAELKVVGNTEGDYVNTLSKVVTETGDDFYMIALESTETADILGVAAWAESNKKMFVALTRDAKVSDENASDDVASLLKKGNLGMGYDRTSLWVSRTPISDKVIFTLPEKLSSGKIRLRAMVRDVLNEYDISLPDTDTGSDRASAFKALETLLKGLVVVKDGKNCHVVETTAISDGDLTATFAKDVEVCIFDFSLIDNTGVSTKLSFSHGTKAILGDEQKRLDGAVCGNRSCRKSGESTLAYQTVKAYTPDSFNDDELNVLDDKRGNYAVMGREGALLFQGITSSGLFFDEIRAVDEIDQRVKEALSLFFVRREKVDFSDSSLMEIENTIFTTINQYVGRGVVLGGSIGVNVKSQEEVTPEEKQTRRLEGTTYTYTLSGSVHRINVVGTIER